jgi:hypothetical protein
LNGALERKSSAPLNLPHSVLKEAAMYCADIPYVTLFAAVYTVVDDWYQEIGWQLVRGALGTALAPSLSVSSSAMVRSCCRG